MPWLSTWCPAAAPKCLFPAMYQVLSVQLSWPLCAEVEVKPRDTKQVALRLLIANPTQDADPHPCSYASSSAVFPFGELH